ncbi:MAG: ABC-F family ATP-binding cassette domain-containing protein [Synergistaceae bacterium]|jgi:ATP-binding cassette subfamily F protein 3|nr:ABC-F family ATP-binding cassette domain-containing protein [Synergistaceae bacterium]
MKKLSLAFGERIILKNVNWLIGERARVGLVGENGAGKTTLLRIIAGELTPDEGSAETGVASIGYLPQDLARLGSGRVMDFLKDSAGLSRLSERLSEAERLISESGERSLELGRYLLDHENIEREFLHLGGYEFEPTARKVLRGLGFESGAGERLCGEFSGGWRMRLALAALLLRNPDILLLDEPTNHLDSESMEWLEGWLRDHRGIMIFVSHDRRFLDKMATEIAEIARGDITRYPMSYEEYIVRRDEERERRERVAAEQRERVDQIQRFVERFRYKASKAAQVQSRIKQLDKMEIYDTDPPSKSVNIRFPEAQRSGYDVMAARRIAKRYGGREIFSLLDLEIYRGQRVALVGVNGAGKSTLLRVISGAEASDEGSVEFGHNVKYAYFSQESAQSLNYAHTVWEEACGTGSAITEAEKRNLLGSFLFSGDDINKPIRVLSGGEKSRVAIFKLLLSDTNFLILDEPTNHLDMKTREIFKRALLRYGGTLLIVSHDRFFLDDLVNRVIEIRDGALYDYPGNYSWFIEKRESLRRLNDGEESAQPKDKSAVEDVSRADSRERRRLEAEERNRIYRERKVFAERIEILEARIKENEERLGKIDADLCMPEVLSDSQRVQSLMIERKILDKTITSDYTRWEELDAEMESVKRRI